MNKSPHIIDLLRHAAFIHPERAMRPRIGDWVVDITRDVPNMAYYGKLVGIEFDENEESIYVVDVAVTGLVEKWSNAIVAAVKIVDYDD